MQTPPQARRSQACTIPTLATTTTPNLHATQLRNSTAVSCRLTGYSTQHHPTVSGCCCCCCWHCLLLPNGLRACCAGSTAAAAPPNCVSWHSTPTPHFVCVAAVLRGWCAGRVRLYPGEPSLPSLPSPPPGVAVGQQKAGAGTTTTLLQAHSHTHSSPIQGGKQQTPAYTKAMHSTMQTHTHLHLHDPVKNERPWKEPTSWDNATA